MKIGLIDIDGKIPNLALMKVSSYYKSQGEQVEFLKPSSTYDRIYASSIFTRSQPVTEQLLKKYGSQIEIGGTGWQKEKRLPEEIEMCNADYSLYTADMIAPKISGIMTKQARYKKAQVIVDAGMGFTSRGCIRNCKFCVVPEAEGHLRQDQEISDIINPRSNVIILHDNNLLADPFCIDKLHEIRDRKLIVDINQGCDVRLMTDDIAIALSQTRHLRSIHFAWDLMCFENQVMAGIKTVLRYIKPYRLMCFMLVGFNTSPAEDMYRFQILRELNIDPYVMIYNQKKDVRLKHFARWVNSRIYNVCRFDEYKPWVNAVLLGKD